MEELSRLDPSLEPGAASVLSLARRIAVEVGRAAGKSIRVVGWIGPVPPRSWEYRVEIEGATTALEVDEASLRACAADDAGLERHIRAQMESLAEAARRGAEG